MLKSMQNDIINLMNSLDTKDISETYKVTVLRHTKAMFKFANRRRRYKEITVFIC